MQSYFYVWANNIEARFVKLPSRPGHSNFWIEPIPKARGCHEEYEARYSYGAAYHTWNNR